MKTIIFIISLLTGYLANAAQYSTRVQYNNSEINQQLNQIQLQQLSTDFIQDYFSNKQPESVIDRLLNDDMTPLEREYIFDNLLTEISQRPPQFFYQDFVNLMKTYPNQAIRATHDDHLPAAVFNLNSKAHGIENIWTAYRTEQHLNQLFDQNMQLAISKIQIILTQKSKQRRPQWLGVKNTIRALSEKSLNKLTTYLLSNIQANSGLDALISHVGLFTGHTELIQKALTSDQTHVREFTLRQLSTHLSIPQAKSLLLQNAHSGSDRKFSTSLLSQFNKDTVVETFLVDQLNDKTTAANAAFALSQSDNSSLPLLLKKRYLSSTDKNEKNHILLTLKLNSSNTAKMTFDDLRHYIEKDSTAEKWIKSFETDASGEQQ